MSVNCELCGKHVTEVGVLHRVNPKGKGQKFIGQCEKCISVKPDPVVKELTDIIQGKEND